MPISPRPGPAPHLARLLRRLSDLPSALIQVWGWPGTGKRALLEALLAGPPGAEGPVGEASGGARPLALAEVESEERLRSSLADPAVATARWLVCLELPEASLVAACRLLRPGQRLIGASRRRLEPADPGLPVSYLGPTDLLLTEGETGALLRDALAGGAPAELAGRLWRLTAGWYAPLRFAAAALAAGELDLAREPAAEALLALPAVEGFLRHEVLEPLPPEVRSALEKLGREGASRDPPSRRSLQALEAYGWGSRAAGGDPIPPLLGASLRRRSDSAPLPASAAPVSGPLVRVALLGPPRISIVAGPSRELEIHWPLKRALKILAYLASCQDFQATRDDLTSALWPEDDEERIARNFHPTVSHLRRTFRESWREACGEPGPPPLLFVHGSYRLNPEIAWEVDTVELSRAGEEDRGQGEDDVEAAIERWQAVAALYRGPFLAGIYDAWAEIPRERYQRRWLDLLRELADLYARLDRFTDAIDAYRRVLIEDPLREPVHQALMRVYSRQGRRDLVRRQYDRLTTLLAEDLGVEPLPQTTEEYHRLMG